MWRRAYEQALAAGSAPDALQVAHGSVRSAVTTKVVVNGREFSSPDEMPAIVRRVFEAVTADADGNGIPDLVEQCTDRASAANLGASPTTVDRGATVRLETIRGRLLLVGGAILLAYLAFSALH